LENFVNIESTRESFDRKLDSLVLFLTTHMSKLTKLALIIHHEHYFRSVARILLPLRKLQVLFIDLTYFLPQNFRSYPETQIADAISGLPELESLYYFPSHSAEFVFCDTETQIQHYYSTLSNGESFVEVMLRRLRVLHAHYLYFPDGMTFDRIQEISLRRHQVYRMPKSVHFPAVRKLHSPTHLLENICLPFQNVTVLVVTGMVSCHWSIESLI